MTGTGDCRRDLGLPYAQRGGLCIGLRGIRAIDKHLICAQHIKNRSSGEAPRGVSFYVAQCFGIYPPDGVNSDISTNFYLRNGTDRWMIGVGEGRKKGAGQFINRIFVTLLKKPGRGDCLEGVFYPPSRVAGHQRQD